MQWYERFDDDLEKLGKKTLEEDYAGELYAALCNMRWRHVDMPKKHEDVLVSYSWRTAGGVVARLRNTQKHSAPLGSDGWVVCTCGAEAIEHANSNLMNRPCVRTGCNNYFRDEAGPEDYLVWYCNGNEGDVSKAIKADMKKMGWSPIQWPDDDY